MPRRGPGIVRAAAWAAVVLAMSVCASAQGQSVTITVARANVRAEPSEKGAVLGQVTLGTVLPVKDVQGDWFHVEVMMNGVRVSAYLSKKVGALVAPAAASAASSAPAAPAPAPDPVRDGFSVTLQSKGVSTPLFAETATIRQIDAKAESVRAGADLLTSERTDAAAEESGDLTFLWTLQGASAARALDDHRPAFVVTFTEVPGYSPENLAPMLVRLAPAPAGTRVVALVRGPANAAMRQDADWDLVKTLKQDVVRTAVTIIQPGGAQLTPTVDLAPGEYAIVFRPSSKKKLAGASVLRHGPETHLFADAWPFSIK